MASSSAGALRLASMPQGDGNKIVSMASSSAGALRPVSVCGRSFLRCPFQWPLRRPGRCAVAGRVSIARWNPGFNGLFVGRGAAPFSHAFTFAGDSGFNGLFVGRGAAPENAGGNDRLGSCFNGLFVGRGAAPIRRRSLKPPRCGFNGLFVGRGAAPLGHWRARELARLFQWPLRRPGRCAVVVMGVRGLPRLVSMASSSAGALRRGHGCSCASPGPEFQWPLRRPGRCARRENAMTSPECAVSMASSSAGALRPEGR